MLVRIGLVAFLLLAVLSVFLFLQSAPSEIYVLEFPKDKSLGELWIVEDVNCFSCGNGKNRAGEAQGRVEVTLPAKHWFIRLDVAKGALGNLKGLKALEANAISAISFSRTDIADGDLVHLSHLRLKHLDLSYTAITGRGLLHLKARSDWLSVDLEGTQLLEPENLKALLGQNRISINLWRSNLDRPGFISALRSRLCRAVEPARCYVQVHGSQ